MDNAKNLRWLPVLDRYMVVDLETQNVPMYGRKANPFIKDNYIVATGWKTFKDTYCKHAYFDSADDVQEVDISPDVHVLVGHNIKFDLHYLWKHKSLQEYIKRGGRIWCTQYAEYLLRGQVHTSHMVALDDIVEKYGGRLKIDVVKKMWNEGILTADIPKDLLIDYLVGTEEEGRNSGDIGNTELIYKAQVAKAEELGMLQIIMDRMDGLLATTEMEYNGLFIDKEEARSKTKELHAKKQSLESKLNNYIPKEVTDNMQFNWNSGVHKSVIIFGGTLKYEKSAPYKDNDGEWVHKVVTNKYYLDAETGEPSIKFVEGEDIPDNCLKYKSGAKKGSPKLVNVKEKGELKTKKQPFLIKLDGYIKPLESIPTTKQNDGAGVPIYSTASEYIELLHNSDVEFIQDLVNLALINKDLGYYIYVNKKGDIKGTLTCLNKDTGIINHNLNHTSTVTGRLSSSNPNLQTLPRKDEVDGKAKSEVKSMYSSRYGDKGYMLEADYSQLEVVVQAVLTGDKQLIQDLIDGVDFHCKRVSFSKGVPYEDAYVWCKDDKHEKYPIWSVYRTNTKKLTFMFTYGGGAQGMSDATGVDLETVKTFIINENALYPQIQVFNDNVLKEVEETAKGFYDPAVGKSYRRGYWTAPTGTRYSWRSYDAPKFLQDKGITDTFSPPEIKNYPIQGTGGEMVQVILGKLFRKFVSKGWWSAVENSKAVLVNTVHDCIWADLQKEHTKEVAGVIKEVMESIPSYYNSTYNTNITVPFPVDTEAGKSMQELNHI